MMYDYMKEEFLNAFDASLNDGNSNRVYTPRMIYALRDMARNDVYPDGRFSDDACNIWSAFRESVKR